VILAHRTLDPYGLESSCSCCPKDGGIPKSRIGKFRPVALYCGERLVEFLERESLRLLERPVRRSKLANEQAESESNHSSVGVELGTGEQTKAAFRGFQGTAGADENRV
jgi:hypothetical protein